MAGATRLPPELEQVLHAARLAALRLDARMGGLRAVLEVNPDLATGRNAAELVHELGELSDRIDELREEVLGRGPLGQLLSAAERSGIEIGELPDQLPWFGW